MGNAKMLFQICYNNFDFIKAFKMILSIISEKEKFIDKLFKYNYRFFQYGTFACVWQMIKEAYINRKTFFIKMAFDITLLMDYLNMIF